MERSFASMAASTFLRYDMNVLGAGHFHPSTVIDNAFLESLDIGTNDEWIMERVGIQTRRTVLPLDYIRKTRNADPRAAREAAQYTAVDLGEKAAQMAIQKAGIDPKEITLCIASTSVPQMCIPAHACLIAARLQLSVPAFDLNSACTSFLAQLHFLSDHKREGVILLVQSETYTMSTHYQDRQTAVLWGDGATAFLLATDRAGKAKILETTFASHPIDADKVVIPYAGHFSQDGPRVQRFAITQTEATFRALKMKQSSPTFIGHQANLRMLETATKRMNIGEDKHLFNVDRYGNCGAAGAPSVLSEKWDSFSAGDIVAIVTVGSGLSWGGAVIQFL